ncbi:uncharacterized protein LOC132754753 [Ruditapes philippinarum]|uniref:uncharacterized protein LOC132754753 n=1 Tax=Ruditapes philippinarum TaxID=129788 RepID=UPI00295BE440|nr:uncharacterized protein LOC132754753 [Ruditapes philippinarum]
MAFKNIFMVLISLQILIVAQEITDQELEETNRHKPYRELPYCPNQGESENGRWRLNRKDGSKRCILDCNKGYSPNGCHVIRKDSYGEWNYNISSCVKDEWLSSKKVACYTAIFGAIAASPYLLSLLGFGSVGILAGSFAAKWMAYIGIVSKGSVFAWLQSLGMTGISKAAILKAMGSAAVFVMV